METFEFDSKPSFAELWDICVHEFLYSKDSYVEEIINLFREIGVSESSKILDSCAGTGFISLYLRQMGYRIDCIDLMEDEIKVFRKNAEKLGVNSNIERLSWGDILKKYRVGTFDFLFCRGNSFIYAAGGWNEKIKVDSEYSLKSYEEILKVFYNVLREGGYLYIDKFSDDETSHKDVLAKIAVCGEEKELLYVTEKDYFRKLRVAALKLRDSFGEEGVVNEAYYLSEGELESLLKRVGFREVRKIRLNSEKNFVIWLARR